MKTITYTKPEKEPCFNFRLINMPDGNQVINNSLKTPINSITPFQMLEYLEVEKQLDYFTDLERKERKQRKAQTHKGFLYKIACICGIL